ncbi:MAG: vitamin K epoxide reductase family protein [Chitinophagaceae bacterium]|nr:vitamin K epoxide reductase family protein [Chitinophagaceae bacterium]
MSNTPEFILADWLSRIGMRVSRTLIYKQVRSHPDYPSLLAVTETLDYLGIRNVAFVSDKETIADVPSPFLASFSGEAAGLLIIDEVKDLEKRYPGFYQQWSGVVITVQKDSGWRNEENEQSLRQDYEIRKKLYAAVTVLSILVVTAFLIIPVWKFIVLTSLSLAGILIAAMIISRELGIVSILPDKFCGRAGDCDAVIQSGKSKPVLGFSWGDVGLIWFSAHFYGLILAAFTGTFSGLITLQSYLAIGSLFFLPYSLYYQWLIKKKWCRLCLLTLGVLVLHASVLLLPVLSGNEWLVPDLTMGLFYFSIIVLSTLLWMAARHLLISGRNKSEEILHGMRFRRNGDVFAALLEKQRNIDAAVWADDIQLGNPEARLQLLVACNPYCIPCAAFHELLHRLIITKNKEAGLIVRFAINHKDKDDKRTKAAGYLLEVILCKAKNVSGMNAHVAAEVIADWYKVMDLERFRKQYPLDLITETGALPDKHGIWAVNNRITHTPSLFINGKEAPSYYDRRDLLWHLSVMADNLYEEEYVN